MEVIVPRISGLNQLCMITILARLTPASKTDDIWYRVKDTSVVELKLLVVRLPEKIASIIDITAKMIKSTTVTYLGLSTLS